MAHYLSAINVNNTAYNFNASKVNGKDPVFIKNFDISGNIISGPSNLSILKVTEEEYAEYIDKPDSEISNILFIVSSDTENAYGTTIENVAISGEYLGNAATDTFVSAFVSPQISELSSAISGAIQILSGDSLIANQLSVIKISKDAYTDLVINDNLNTSALYVVDSDQLDAYEQTIQNVAEPELSSDAATKNYVDTEISKIDVSEQLTSYVTKEYVDEKGGVTVLSNDEFLTNNLSVVRIEPQKYYELIHKKEINTSTLYVVESVGLNSYGLPITNVGDPIESTDAVNASTLSSYVSNYVSTHASKLNISVINQDTFHDKVRNNALGQETIYIISGDYINAYNSQLKNLATGSAASDAATVGQVATMIENSKAKATFRRWSV